MAPSVRQFSALPTENVPFCESAFTLIIGREFSRLAGSAQRVRSKLHLRWPAGFIKSAIWLRIRTPQQNVESGTRLVLIVRLTIISVVLVFSFRLRLLNVRVALTFMAAGGMVELDPFPGSDPSSDFVDQILVVLPAEPFEFCVFGELNGDAAS